MEHRELMKLADAYAEASFGQGLHQRTEDPAPEIAREKLVQGIKAEVQSAVAAERAAWDAVQQSHQRLVLNLDVALNGADRAALQASLCDLVSQVQRMVSEGLIVGA